MSNYLKVIMEDGSELYIETIETGDQAYGDPEEYGNGDIPAMNLESVKQKAIEASELFGKVLPTVTGFAKGVAEQIRRDIPSDENREAVISSYKNFTPDERKLLRYSLNGGSPQSLAADILLRYEDETALELCLKNGLQPSDPSRLALFYYLSQQWEQYYSTDTDYRRIRLAYEEKDPDLQRRLIWRNTSPWR